MYREGYGDAGGAGVAGGFDGVFGGGRRFVWVGSVKVARMMDEVLQDFEESLKGRRRIMAPREKEHEMLERALPIYKKLRDVMENGQHLGGIWIERVIRRGRARCRQKRVCYRRAREAD